MIITHSLCTSLEINSLNDLYKLKIFMEETNLKVNKSQIARELDVDRRTVTKYIDGFKKSPNRQTHSKIDGHYDTIKKLLDDSCIQRFFYKKNLWQYLIDNHKLDCSESSFRRWISNHEEFDKYFNGTTNRTVNGVKRDCTTTHQTIHYETDIGQEAQLDWKEDMSFTLNTGEIISVNVFSLVYSYSRYMVNFLSLTKKQEALFHYLDQAFKIAGGVPKRLKTDNMKTVMDVARTEFQKGKVNNKFQNMADDYGFDVYPCIAGRPWSKGRVETPMKLWDELFAYNGKLSYPELHKKVRELNERFNNRIHQGTGKIPLLHLGKEKSFLSPLPPEEIRSQYQISTTTVKTSSQSTFSHKNKQYSVPPEYIGKRLSLQIYDDHLHVYYNMNLVAVHKVSSNKWNYQADHYTAIYESAFKSSDPTIKELALKNLKLMEEIYSE